jgi:cell volume regulation protein A
MELTFPTEPLPTAIGLAVLGLLVAVAVTLSRTIGRRGVPVVLLFMVLGMVAGSEGIGGIAFEDYALTFRLGTVALVFILFDGGLNTSAAVVRSALAPAGVLATLGVALTAGVVGLAGRLVGLAWLEALLLGAVVSSTDAAAVFSVLRGSGVHLKQRVAATLELESGLNDPMAVILTIGLTKALVSGQPPSWTLLASIALQMVVGAALGVAIGYAGRWMLRRPVLSGGLYPVLTLAISCLAFGVPTIFYGSGFLAVYVAGLWLGNGPLPYRSGILRAHDFVAWFSQVLMFLALGLLAFPSQLMGAVFPGLVIAGALALVARPLGTWICLLPFRYAPRELVYVSWVGLRGAVPIILATFPMMAGLEQGSRIFNIVFFVVVVSALIQGWSVRSVTHWLGLETAAPPPPPASVEISSVLPLKDEILTFFIERSSRACDKNLIDLHFPEGAAAMMIVRGPQLIAPKGKTTLRAGDYVSVFCRPEDREHMHRLFGAGSSEPPGEAATAEG